MATRPNIFERPLMHDGAMCNVEVLHSLPHCRVIGEEEDRFWKIYRKMIVDVPTRGNLVLDAYLASILAGNGVTTYTRDRDFPEFSVLKVRDPRA